MNEKIDVLAVLDRAADRAALLPELATDLTNARAAITELIEADKEYDAAMASVPYGSAENIKRVEVAVQRRAAALAVVGGAK